MWIHPVGSASFWSPGSVSMIRIWVAKKSVKIMGNSHKKISMKITRNQKIENWKLHFCLTHINISSNKLIQSIIKSFLEHINFYGENFLNFLVFFSILGRIRSRSGSASGVEADKDPDPDLHHLIHTIHIISNS